MSCASENHNRAKHSAEGESTPPQSGKHRKRILICILSSAFVLSAVLAVFTAAGQSTQSGSTVTEEEISYVDARIAKARSLTAAAKAAKSIRENIEIPIAAYALRADGELIAVSSSKEDIESALSELKKNAVKDFPDAEAELVEDVEILEGMYLKSEFKDKEELSSLLGTKSEKTITHTVEKGETRDTIAEYYGISVSRLESLNPSIKDSKIKTGDKLTVTYEKAPVSVKFAVTETKTETVKFKKETVEDSTLSTSYKEVTTEGQDGESEITRELIYTDGRVVSERLISEEVITEVVNEITTVGTNDNPTAPTGSFSWPLPGYDTITSEFGPRWGTNHNGLDISGSDVYGASIVASDGGTVILSQEDNSGYGKYVIIDHGNGYQTLYGHCSELCVSVGDEVSIGQKIAEVGSTGDSTGPHLHFEIIDNGTKVDPYPFLFD